MEIEIIERDPMLIVGWQARFVSNLLPNANNSRVIGELWEKTFDLAAVGDLSGSLGGPLWGVIWEDTPDAEELNYLAGVAFSEVPALPEGMTSRAVPAQTYAKTTHRGSLNGLKETIEQLHHWVDEQGYVAPANWHDLELYDDRFLQPGPDQAFDYFISIQRP
ncbi:MAG: GyrI-like domain-containing protein [Planctomycetota bacterium]